MANKGAETDNHLLGIEKAPKIANAPIAVKLAGCGISLEKAASKIIDETTVICFQFLFMLFAKYIHKCNELGIDTK